MQIITNADDFGQDEDTVRATIECLDCGALSSATIMPNMPATPLAIEYAIHHPKKSFGAHLTYVCDTVEAPVCDPASLPTLTGADGRFLDSPTMRMRALRGELAQGDIERETMAQLQRLVDLGVRVTHVDSHGHLHKFRVFRQALENVLPHFGVHRVRNVQNVFLQRRITSPTFWFNRWWRRSIMHAFTTTTDFFMPRSGFPDNAWPQRLLSIIRTATTMEVGVHPGYREPWRDAERRMIQEFAMHMHTAGHRLIGWHDIAT